MNPSHRVYRTISIVLLLSGVACSAGSFLVRAPRPTPTPTKTSRSTFTPTLIPTETPIPTDTFTPSPLPTVTPSLSPTPAPPTDTPTPTIPNARISTTVNVREGPGTNFGRIGRVTEGHSSDVFGRSADNSWIFINFSGGQGWVSAQFANIDGNLAQADVIEVQAPAPAANNPPPAPTEPPQPTNTPVPSYPFPAVPVVHPTGGDIELRITGFVWQGSAAGIGEALAGFQMEVVTPTGEVKTSEVSVGPFAGASTTTGAGDNHAMNFQFKNSPYIPGVYQVTLKKDGAQMAPTINVTAQAGPPYSYIHVDFIDLQ
ncbi:MAG: SH3 domain-containing protein [Chloroflexota bacterium]